MAIENARFCLRLTLATVICLSTATSGATQTTATLTGRVVDGQGGVLPGATVTLANVVTGFERTIVAADEATFRLTNLPLQQYRLTVSFPGFQAALRDIDLRTSVPVSLDIELAIAAQRDSVTVSADQSAPLVDMTLTGTRTAVSVMMIEQMPTATGSRGLESVLVSFPGFAQNANGAIHPRGAHNQMTYVVDGLPISDQLTGAFANALDTGIVQNVELMTGNIPAEFGSKVSGVAVVTTRSGLGSARGMTGDVSVRAGQFETVQTGAQIGGQHGGLGYFGTVTAMRTERFLDQVSLDNLHNAGAFVRGFLRYDFHATDRDMLRVQAMGGRSRFDIANLRSQHAAGQDQQQTLADGAGWASYLRSLDSGSTFESIFGYRGTTAQLDASPGDTPVTASQQRSLKTLTASLRYTKVKGSQHLRAGV